MDFSKSGYRKGRLIYCEGARAGALTVPKIVQSKPGSKQRILVTALCCYVPLPSWLGPPHVDWSGRRIQLPRHFESYGTEARDPRRKRGSQRIWLSLLHGVRTIEYPRYRNLHVLISRDSQSPGWSRVLVYQACPSNLEMHSLDRFLE